MKLDSSDEATFKELLVNLVRADPDHSDPVFEVFRDNGVSLPNPITPGRESPDEALPDDSDSLPGAPVTPAPWWLFNPDVFRCSVTYGLDYKVTCVHRRYPEPDEDRPRPNPDY